MKGWVLFLLLAVPPALFAADYQDGKETLTEKKLTVVKGLRFNMPEDWPIETRNNVTAPIPIEEYVTLKFKKMDQRISALESQMQNLNPAEKKTAVESTGKRLQSSQKAISIFNEGETVNETVL